MRTLPLVVFVVGSVSFIVLCATGVALAGSEAFGGGSEVITPDESYVLPRKLKAKLNEADPDLGKLTLRGLLDTGPDAVDLTAAATLDVGDWSLDAGALVPSPNGKTFIFEDEGLLFRLKASPIGSSKVTFKLKATGDFEGLLAEDADNDVLFTSAACEGTSTVTLDGLSFTLGKQPGTLVSPPLYLQAAKAKLPTGGDDSLVMRLGIATAGIAPPVAPEVSVGFGESWSALVPGASFTRVGTKDVYVGEPGGLTSLVLDYAKERMTVKAKGIDLGDFADGASAVTVSVQLDLEGFAIAVRMVKKGAALKY
jgi:hypothetical protein